MHSLFVHCLLFALLPAMHTMGECVSASVTASINYRPLATVSHTIAKFSVLCVSAGYSTSKSTGVLAYTISSIDTCCCSATRHYHTAMCCRIRSIVAIQQLQLSDPQLGFLLYCCVWLIEATTPPFCACTAFLLCTPLLCTEASYPPSYNDHALLFAHCNTLLMHTMGECVSA